MTIGSSQKKIEEKLRTKWAWYSILYNLSNKNILKMEAVAKEPVLKTLTFLLYQKENNN
jgi:hypothetical protein